jgi:mono/diheme cytochrome c family protein
MRYFVIGLLLAAVVVVSVAGFRGGLSRRPPIELFPDMDRQAKLRPQSVNEFFPDRLSSRPHPAQTVARGQPTAVAGRSVYAFENHPLNTGMAAGTPPGVTNYIEVNPLPVTAALLARGKERYTITCQPCHGAAGDGKGTVTKFGMTIIADLHDVATRKVVQMPDGQLFDTISNGKNLMQGYAATIAPVDRWAIVAYVRALQLSRLAGAEELPADQAAAVLRK